MEAQLEDWQLANLREMRRNATGPLPRRLAGEPAGPRQPPWPRSAWLEAKQESNFELFAPHLEEVVALTRDKAQVLSQALASRPTIR